MRIGCSITGPIPGLIAKSTPIPSSGIMMSANSTAPSTPEAVDRHQRRLHRQLRRPGHGQEGVLLAQRPVLGQATPGLAHEPDRGGIGHLTGCRRQEARAGSHRCTGVVTWNCSFLDLLWEVGGMGRRGPTSRCACQPGGGFLGVIGDDPAGPGPLHGKQRFERHALLVNPANRAAALTIANSPDTL